MFQRARIALNLLGANKRTETLEGKEYLVVPTVSLTEGVHCGDQGPLYYPPEELAKDPGAWNHHPAVVNHPQLNGEGISACDPKVVEEQRVGMLFNSVYDGRLKHETWIDTTKLKKVNNTVLEAINKNQMVEVSTGLFLDVEDTPGEWNGEKYIGIARNFRPDHLAILPDTKGACSIADGAGLLRNSEELSYNDIRDQLGSLLRATAVAVNEQGETTYNYCWICDIYKSSAVYEMRDKYYKVGYKVKNGKVSIVGETEEVRKVTSYVANSKNLLLPSLDKSGIISSNTQPTKEPPMATPVQNVFYEGTSELIKQALAQMAPELLPVTAPTRETAVEQMIANNQARQEDRTFLLNLSSDQFAKLHQIVQQKAPSPKPPVQVVNA